MCVIIIKDKPEQKILNNTLALSAALNPHGLGVVWLDTFELEYYKSTEYGVLSVNRPFIAHFRYATVGKVCKENTHPFNIDENTLLFQNGTNDNLGYRGCTDTEHLADILSVCDRAVWADILELTDSRYVTVDLKEQTYEIYNEMLWRSDPSGVLYSKQNVLHKSFVAVYGTLRKGNSNYKNYLRSSSYLGTGNTVNKYGMIIKGLPYVLSKKGIGHNIEVDMFAVDRGTLGDLDALEGHPNWYVRKKVQVNVNGVVLTGWLYFNDTVEDTGEYHKSYPVGDYWGGTSQNKTYSYVPYDDYENSLKDTCGECGWCDIEYDADEQANFCYNCDNYDYGSCNSISDVVEATQKVLDDKIERHLTE